ncbi:hypothetical protein N0M98_24370 [Paenibacillus doosanensis]|uniref:Amidase n=1 Tax=Paenibacillus konkukensis TaxID=2020716 RepID=A0ABY4RSW8_9BACL|nr:MULTISPECIES: hypothetical protein [Paenibacillus]MCS7463263.1 hypothetical protein [Paenibacillus doosanensis]UQZ85203.1 hypothetical protein SK3146_04486 [Paenibacillus konkukensis]
MPSNNRIHRAGGRMRVVNPLLVVVLLFSLLGPKSGSAGAPLASGKLKATWLWDTALIATQEGRNTILGFAREQAVGRIYLQVDRGVAAETYGLFIEAASQSGIQVHALDGAPDWVLPAQSDRVAGLVRWVADYNRLAEPSRRFGGVQIDVEPYLLPQWNTDRERIAAEWLDTVTRFAEEARRQSEPLTIGAALPFWLDEIELPELPHGEEGGESKSHGEGRGTLLEPMMKQLDEMTLMSYRDQAEAIIDMTAAELLLGDLLGKKVFVGVETNPDAAAPYITFHGKGRKEMERQLLILDAMLSAHSSYAGIAVHDYSGWSKLTE